MSVHFILLILSFAAVSSALQCFHCNEKVEGCRDLESGHSIPTKACDRVQYNEGFNPTFPIDLQPILSKSIQESDTRANDFEHCVTLKSEKYFQRSCAEGSTESLESFKKEHKDQYEVFFCEDDYCNFGNTILPTSTLFIALFFSLFYVIF